MISAIRRWWRREGVHQPGAATPLPAPEEVQEAPKPATSNDRRPCYTCGRVLPIAEVDLSHVCDACRVIERNWQAHLARMKGRQ